MNSDQDDPSDHSESKQSSLKLMEVIAWFSLSVGNIHKAGSSFIIQPDLPFIF